MTDEDEEFNRMEREAEMRRKAVSAALTAQIMHMRAHLSEYERGVIDGRQMQVQSSVDKAVSALSKREWVGLTEDEITECFEITPDQYLPWQIYRRIENKLKEKNGM